jgi:hypothetical protein
MRVDQVMFLGSGEMTHNPAVKRTCASFAGWSAYLERYAAHTRTRNFMRKHLAITAAAALFAAVWGYFSDLQNGQTGWFIGRLIFVGSLAFLSSYFGSKSKASVAPRESR